MIQRNKKRINEEIGTFDQIPFKRAKIWKYRLKSQTVFWKDIYNKRMNVESVINVIKRRFNGINFSSPTQKSSIEKLNWKT